MTCVADISSVEGRSNPGSTETSPTSDAAREQLVKESILSREVKVSRINWKITQVRDLKTWKFSEGTHQKDSKES
ncbi:hypothetical protein TNCV_5118331 [Trichonephila clavipes]|nr:hypothetical protein TNCV_5118331 [Trichonephila clavipes]